MTFIDATVIREPSNADEVLAYFLSYAEPDDVITLHTGMCRTQLHVCEDCTCTPRSMRLGAKA